MSYTANDIVSLSAGRAFRDKENYSNYLIFEDGTIYSKKSNKYLKPFKKTSGYYAVNLYDNFGKAKMFFLHRLIAELFIPNPLNYTDVNHKDEDKSNNSLNNLEWCNKSYNENYGSKKIRELQTKTNTNKINGRKKIKQFDLSGNFIKEWDSLSEASKNLKIPVGNISSVIHGKRNQAGGYIWKVI